MWIVAMILPFNRNSFRIPFAVYEWIPSFTFLLLNSDFAARREYPEVKDKKSRIVYQSIMQNIRVYRPTDETECEYFCQLTRQCFTFQVSFSQRFDFNLQSSLSSLGIMPAKNRKFVIYC